MKGFVHYYADIITQIYVIREITFINESFEIIHSKDRGCIMYLSLIYTKKKIPSGECICFKPKLTELYDTHHIVIFNKK